MKGTHFIDGSWVAGSGATFGSTDPATGDTNWQGAAADADQVARAVSAARRAFEHWSELAIEQRIGFLRAFGEQVKSNRTRLSGAISREVGKPRWEADAEVDAVGSKIDQSINAYTDRRRITESESRGVKSATRYKPHGVVAVFGPFNFPAHLPNGHIIPALLAGNTVVFKPSEAAPMVAELMVGLWQAAALPSGVLNLVQGGREAGQILASHRGIDGVFFTGSFAAGSAINQLLAAEPGKIVALEMGGNNPLVVHDVSDLDAAVYMIIQSAYVSAGQRCTCARRLIIPDGPNVQPLLDRLRFVVTRLKVGRFDDEPQPFMGPVISDTAAEKVLAAQDELRDRGGKVLVELKSVGERKAMLSPGLIDTTDVKERDDSEVFGPLLQVIRVRDFDAAIDEANNTSYGLAAGLLCDDVKLWQTFYRRIRAGVVNWNRPTTGATGGQPFGGVGRSGNHRPSGYFAADYCSFPVASMESAKIALPASLPPGIDLGTR